MGLFDFLKNKKSEPKKEEKPSESVLLTVESDEPTELIEGFLVYSGTRGNPHEHLVKCSQEAVEVTLHKDTLFIDSFAFAGCKNLKKVYLNDLLSFTGMDPFVGCKSLEFNKYENCNYLGNENNKYLLLVDGFVDFMNSFPNTVIIHEKCRIIGSEAFKWCSNLEKLSIPDSVVSLSVGSFNACRHITDVHLGNNVEVLDDYSFGLCSSLENINFPSSLKKIGDSCFGWTPLKKAILNDGLEEIGEFAFNRCYFDELVIPNSVKRIKGCFLSDGSAKKLVLSTNLEDYKIFSQSHVLDRGDFKEYKGGKYFGSKDNEYAFFVEKDKDGLKELHPDTEIILRTSEAVINGTLNIGDKLKYFDSLGTNGIKKLVVSENNPYFILSNGILYSKDKKTLILYPSGFGGSSFVVPSFVENVGPSAFPSCKLTEIDFGSVTKICTGSFMWSELSKVKLPETLKEFEARTFSSCKVSELIFPKEMKKMSGYCWESSFRHIVLPNKIKDFNLVYQFNDKFNYNVENGNCYIGSHENPYFLLVKAAPYSNFDSINPKTEYISGEAFKESRLSELDFTQCKKKIIGKIDLRGSQQLRSVVLDGGELSNYAFSGCKSLASVKLSNIKEISESCFAGCESLSEFSVDSAIHGINYSAFSGCLSLRKISLPNSIHGLGSMTFEKSGLEIIEIPYGVKEISFDVFAECRNLSTLILPKSIRIIDTRLFGDSISRKYNVQFKGTKDEWNSIKIIGNYYSKEEFLEHIKVTFDS